MYQSLINKNEVPTSPPLVVSVDDLKVNTSYPTANDSAPLINERTGLPSGHIFGTEGTFAGSCYYFEIKTKKSNNTALIIAVLLAILLFIFKKL